MKTYFKLIIYSIALITSLTLKAQTFTSKGAVELGGEFSFTSQSESVSGYSYSYGSESSSYGLLMFSPYLGVMMGQGFELGFEPSIANSKSSTLLNLFFAPAYNINTGGNAYPYLEGLIGYSAITDHGSVHGLGIGLGGGVKVAIGSSALFLFSLKYLSQSYEYEYTINNYTYTGYSYYSYPTTLKVKETINTFFAGIGFHIFITPKAQRPSSLPLK
jgi:hypothetical protein